MNAFLRYARGPVLPLLIGGFLLGFLSVKTARAQQSTIVLDGPTVPPLYQSYDSRTGKLKTGSCVQDAGPANPQLVFEKRRGFSSGPLPGVGVPQVVSYSVSHIQDSESLQSTLSLSASASFNIGFGSGSASYNYFSQSNFSTYSEYLAVEVTVENQTDTHANVKYTQKAQRLIDQGKFAQFYQLCGDSFIVGKVSGGYFLAVAKFDTQSSSDQTSTSAALNATVGLYGSASATMSANLSTLSNYKNVNVQILRKGPSDTVDDSIAGIIDYAQKFPDRIANGAAYVTEVVVAEYPGDPVSSIPPAQAVTIDRLARALGKAYQRKADLKYAANHTDQFPQISKGDFTTNQDDIAQLIDSLKAAGSLCENDVTKCGISKYPTIPNLPDRAEWIPLVGDKDPDKFAKACPPIMISSTTRDSDMSIQLDGYWTAWSTGENWFSVNQTHIYFQDQDGVRPQVVIAPTPDVLYKVPAYSEVDFMVGDGPTCAAFPDNRMKPGTPVRYRIYDENRIQRVNFGSLSALAASARKKQ